MAPPWHATNDGAGMDTTRFLLAAGTILLSAAALAGFAQHAFRDDLVRAARWRVVHNGGTAGAVQLLTCAAIWHQLALDQAWSTWLAAGLAASTWAFFVGPLCTACGQPGSARIINRLGGLLGLPSYLALPAILLR
jgi:hypothetical protein